MSESTENIIVGNEGAEGGDDAEKGPRCDEYAQKSVQLCDNDVKLALEDVRQYYLVLTENDKSEKLLKLIHRYHFMKIMVFMKSPERCVALAQQLSERNVACVIIHKNMSAEERVSCYEQSKNMEYSILIVTDNFWHGINLEGANIVMNFDAPEDSNKYVLRTLETCLFDNDGIAITFISSELDAKILNDVEKRFDLVISLLPEQDTNFCAMSSALAIE